MMTMKREGAREREGGREGGREGEEKTTLFICEDIDKRTNALLFFLCFFFLFFFFSLFTNQPSH